MVHPAPALPATSLKPFARSYAVLRDPIGINIKRPRGATQSYPPPAICSAYNWPTAVAVNPLTIVIGELGGAMYQADIALWAAKAGLPAPTVRTVLLPGADASAGMADGEVALDWQLAAAAWSYITGLAANIVIVYGPNSGQAFADCQNYAARLGGVGAFSWSWGSPEPWPASDMAALDASAQACPFPITAASGDNGSNDGTNSPDTDLPASSPYITGCGGTSRVPNGGAEVVWNTGNFEGTGGGFSKVYPRPTWQPANAQGNGRMVPDLAAVADPATGYDVVINGQWQVIGGTSAVAPLMAGFFAAVNGARLKAGLPMIGQINPLLWAVPSCFYDIVNGTNGAFNATIGADPCTGLGRALATLFAVLSGASQTPPPVIPPPVVPPPVTPPPVLPAWRVRLPAIAKGHLFPPIRAGRDIPADDYNAYHAHGAAEREIATE